MTTRDCWTSTASTSRSAGASARPDPARRLAPHARRRDRRPDRRDRLGQDHARPDDPRPEHADRRAPSASPARPSRRCADASCAPSVAPDRSSSSSRTRCARSTPTCASARSSPRAWRSAASWRAAELARAGRARRLSRSASIRRCRPAPGAALGRPAPARRDRPGARRRPAPARLRRAGVGARRLQSQPDPAAARRAARAAGIGILVISHDLSSLAGIADRIAVLYRGRVLEDGPTEQVLGSPRHPYSALLVASAPSVPHDARSAPRALRRAPGTTRAAPAGADAVRLRRAVPVRDAACATAHAALSAEAGSLVACHHADSWQPRAAPGPRRGCRRPPRAGRRGAVTALNPRSQGGPSASSEILGMVAAQEVSETRGSMTERTIDPDFHGALRPGARGEWLRSCADRLRRRIAARRLAVAHARRAGTPRHAEGPVGAPPWLRRANADRATGCLLSITWRAVGAWRCTIITGGDEADQRRDGDFLGHDARYRRTAEYLR